MPDDIRDKLQVDLNRRKTQIVRPSQNTLIDPKQQSRTSSIEESKERTGSIDSKRTSSDSKAAEAPLDYTTQAELDAFEQTVQLKEPYIQLLCTQVGLSCQNFFKKFHADDAAHPYDKFFASKEAKIFSITEWKEPATEEEKTFQGHTVIKQRAIDAEFKVDSAFVKAAPTLKTYRVIENSATCIKILCTNRTRDIPYCDTFDVEDFVTVHSMKPTSQVCIVQIGVNFIWHKSTMMKSMIKGNAEKEARAINEDYLKLLKQYPFIE